MATAAGMFKQQLAVAIGAELGGQFKVLKSRGELRAPAAEGDDVIILSVAAKYSPYVSVDFYFGRNFSLVRNLERRYGLYKFPYHIQQFSPNRSALAGLAYSGPHSWSVNIQEPLGNLPIELAEAIRGIAAPFFERFSALHAAREALAADDPWCFGGPGFWRQLLHLNLAMGEVARFRDWSQRLSQYDRNQAESKISKYLAAKGLPSLA